MRFLLISIFYILFASHLYAVQNHYVILQKKQHNGQTFITSGKFPKKWIEDKWNESYRISHVNFKRGEWFIVMDKKNNPRKQTYYFSPSDQVIQDKLADGYDIVDICLFNDLYQIKSLYVFTKVSTAPIKNYFYYVGGIGRFTNTLSDRVKEGLEKGFTSEITRNITYKNVTRAAILMHASPNNGQIYAYRKEFPNDFINNKRSNGYYLSNIAYDNLNGSWFVVMRKNPLNYQWAWFNYKVQKAEFLDYWRNKGYTITGVF